MQKTACNISQLIDAYHNKFPDPAIAEERVAFGTSGHRGTSANTSFNKGHIQAITQAVCDWRSKAGITGPLFMGKDTHALSTPAEITALEVLVANKIEVYTQKSDLPTPTPVISHAILQHNKTHTKLADGIVVTPSHNPPEDGGFKYNEFHGGPADTATTKWIETRANELLAEKNNNVRTLPASEALSSSLHRPCDFITPYVADLKNIINMEAIANAGVKLAVDPMGGAGLPYWEPIARAYGLNLTVVNKTLDPTFSFMPKDHDGVIRMDCSSPYAMANLMRHAKEFDLAFGNDPDADRHGIVTTQGLMNPNHYLSVVVWYLLRHRPKWSDNTAIGKTAVTTHLINKICTKAKKKTYETPVGFKWFVQGLFTGFLSFGGEESAGASFLRKNGSPWSTDKDGILLNLLAAEITAVIGKNPASIYQELEKEYGAFFYNRTDAPANAHQKKLLSSVNPSAITATSLAGSPIVQVQTTATGNDAPIGGIKVITEDGWFAARPSGTEALYKIYAESFTSINHLKRLEKEAQLLVSALFSSCS